jgi:hypothetical protein
MPIKKQKNRDKSRQNETERRFAAENGGPPNADLSHISLKSFQIEENQRENGSKKAEEPGMTRRKGA